MVLRSSGMPISTMRDQASELSHQTINRDLTWLSTSAPFTYVDIERCDLGLSGFQEHCHTTDIARELVCDPICDALLIDLAPKFASHDKVVAV